MSKVRAPWQLAGLEHPEGLRNLTMLHLQGRQVTDEGRKKLKQALDVVDQPEDQFVVEVVDQTDAVNKVLWRQVKLVPSKGKVDEIGTDRVDVILKSVFLGSVRDKCQGF